MKMNAVEQVMKSAALMNALGVPMSDIMADVTCLYQALVGRPLMGLEGEWVKELAVKAANKTDNCRNTDDMVTPR
jgi:hypothetical protein